MASLLFKKSCSQYVVYLTIDGLRKTFYLGKDENEAKKQYYELMSKHHGQELSVSKLKHSLFIGLADAFLNDNDIKNSITRETLADYSGCLSLFCSLYSSIKCDEIDIKIIKEFKQYLLARKDQGSIRKKIGVSPQRAKKYIGIIYRVFNWAFEEGRLKPSEISLPKLKRES